MVGEFAELGNEALDLLDHLRQPEVDELPMPTHSPGGARTLLRDLALFLAAAPMVLAALLGSAQLGSAASMSGIRVDTRSEFKADYGAWTAVEFGPVSPALLEDVARDRSLFPGIYGGAASPVMVPGDFWRIPFDLGANWKPHSSPTSYEATGETVSVRATVHLLWGILSLEAGSNEYLEDIGGRSALPLLIVVDARGNGTGWHLTVRAREEQRAPGSDGADVSRFELSLPESNIESIDGYGVPSSQAILPTPLSEADQLLAVAESGVGMGTFGLVPSIYQVSIGRPSRDVPILGLDVSIIASP